MKKAVRTAIIALVVSIVLAPLALAATPAAIGFTEAPAGDEPAADEPVFAPGMEPAVITPPVEEAAQDDPWTARYLAPVLVVLGVVTFGLTALAYVVRVRGRYEVVD